MVEGDGVYRSERLRVQRRKKIAVGVAGLAAILAGGGYAVTAWRGAQHTTIVGDTGAFAPPALAAPSSPARPAKALPAPTAVTPPPSTRPSPRLSAARRSTRPSARPTPSAMPDEEVASAMVSQLLQLRRATASGGLTAAGREIVVAAEPGADGSAIRIVSARHDLTGRGALLWAADAGRPVGDARCTQNFRIGGGAVRETRPGLLLCWRVSPVKSVVTVASSPTGSPVAATSARVIERVWRRMN
jgi:hypothetical protein